MYYDEPTTTTKSSSLNDVAVEYYIFSKQNKSCNTVICKKKKRFYSRAPSTLPFFMPTKSNIHKNIRVYRDNNRKYYEYKEVNDKVVDYPNQYYYDESYYYNYDHFPAETYNL